MDTEGHNPVSVFARELERRCQKNARYSLRAFARSLGLSHTVLSFVLSGKRPVSKKVCHRLLGCSDLPEKERSLLTSFIQEKLWKSSSVQFQNAQSDENQITLDQFALISQWHHYAILSLLQLPDFQPTAKWMTSRLGISEIETQMAWQRLKRLRLVVYKKRKWQQNMGGIRINNSRASGATVKFQKQLLEKALQALENCPIENRDYSSMTFAMTPSLVPYARERIRKFRRELAEELEHMEQGTEVYNMTVQLYPVTIRRSKNEKENT